MKGETGMDIGHRIFELRKEQGLSQEQFAEMFHVTRQTVSNWENNKNYPDMNTLKDISDRFGVSFDYLLKEDNELIEKIDSTRKSASLRKKIIIVLGILVVAALLVIAVPKLIDNMYYNPLKIAASYVDEDGCDYSTNQIEMDMKVYDELFIPSCSSMDNINISKIGLAAYNVNIGPSAWTGGKPETVTGQIKRGKVTWYNPDPISVPISNAFSWTSGEAMDIELSASEIQEKRMKELRKDPDWDDETMSSDFGSGVIREDFDWYIDNLDDKETYMTYISFDKILDYEKAVDWADKYDAYLNWAGIVTDNECNGRMIGMNTTFEGSYLYWDNEKFPYLLWYEDYNSEEYDPEHEIVPDNELAKKRFVTMLKYMDGQKKFMKMMNTDGHLDDYIDTLNSRADFIEENGIRVYGLAGRASKKDLQKISRDKNVYSIYVDENR